MAIYDKTWGVTYTKVAMEGKIAYLFVANCTNLSLNGVKKSLDLAAMIARLATLVRKPSCNKQQNNMQDTQSIGDRQMKMNDHLKRKIKREVIACMPGT